MKSHRSSTRNLRLHFISAITVFLGLLLLAQTTRAGFSWTGDVLPDDPNTWTIKTHGCIGCTAEGTVTVDGGSHLLSDQSHIGDTAEGTGQVTIDGEGTEWTCDDKLYIGYYGNGTLAITGGALVGADRDSYIGCYTGSTGDVTVDGVGSMWNSNYNIIVGDEGDGMLTITGGGAVSNYSCYIGDNAGSTGQVTVDGAGSTWTNSSYLIVGDNGSGTLTITNGGAVLSSVGGLYGNTSHATVDGVGSTWTNGGTLGIGDSYNVSILDITGGGSVSSAGGSIGGNGNLYISRVTVDGVGSTWTMEDPVWNAYLYVNGKLEITNGGTVSNKYCVIGYESYYDTGEVVVDGVGSTWTTSERLTISDGATLEIAGGGAVSCGRGVIEGQVTIDGIDSMWTIFDSPSQYNNGELYVAGKLTISDGGTVSCDSGFIDYTWTGHALVDGAGSTWNCGDSLTVGYLGGGTLAITGGGAVKSDAYSYIGISSNSTGQATVDGIGSIWDSTVDLYVGLAGAGTLDISIGGLVSVGGTLFVDFDADGDSFINMSTGGMLALSGDVDGSIAEFLGIVSGTDAIRYWDYSISDWADISGATYGDDYMLEYLTTGDLAGYTVLTVGTAGDFDGDTDADGADFLAWQRGESTNPLSSSDLLAWQVNFGSPSGTPTSHTVPEPGTLTLLSLAVLGCLHRRGRGWNRGPIQQPRHAYMHFISASCVVLLITSMLPKAHADVIWIGDAYVYGSRPPTTYIGKTTDGTLTIDGDSRLSSDIAYIGYEADSTGRVIVDGGSADVRGAEWYADRLAVGYGGDGVLAIFVSRIGVSNDTQVAQQPGSSGEIHFIGGILETGGLLCGIDDLTGTGTINTSGLVSDVDLVIASQEDLEQTVTLNELPGQNVTINLYLDGHDNGSMGAGYAGTATTSISGGFGLGSLQGYIGYKAGSNGTVNVDGNGTWWYCEEDLYVGREGNGTMNITGGGGVWNSTSYDPHEGLSSSIGYAPGSTGQVTVDGAGSQWYIYGDLTIGREGSGTLNISNGGEVINEDGYTYISRRQGSSGAIRFDGGTLTTDGLIGSTDSITGTGTINTKGIVSDLDLVFDATHGTSQTISLVDPPTQNITLNIDVDATGPLGAGFNGEGSLTIADGVSVASGLMSYIGYNAGATGVATVEGLGTSWQCYELVVGPGGNGTVLIRDGGTVTNGIGVFGGRSEEPIDSPNPSSYFYGASGGSGNVVVDGDGSTWNVNSAFHMYRGSLTIQNGGTVTTGGTSYVGWDENVPENANAGTVLVDGVGSTWTHSSRSVSIGCGSRGTVTIQNGGTASLGYLNVGFAYSYITSPSHGSIIVRGQGSTLQSMSMLVGNGELAITDGGVVSSASASIARDSGSTGQATVDGIGSVWTNSDDLAIGPNGQGTLEITSGGLVSVGATLTIDKNADGDSFIYMATGGMLALASDEHGDDSLNDFLDLIVGTDAIRYWDTGLFDWSPITSATYGDDYTLEYLATGDLAGFTLLTVGMAGDFDGDYDVDGADLLAWQRGETPRHLGTSELSAWKDNFGFPFEGDFDFDGDVDGADFIAWQRNPAVGDLADWQAHFGGGSAAATAAVPEPAAASLMLLAAASLLLRRRGG